MTVPCEHTDVCFFVNIFRFYALFVFMVVAGEDAMAAKYIERASTTFRFHCMLLASAKGGGACGTLISFLTIKDAISFVLLFGV